jgi:hypothetical protein
MGFRWNKGCFRGYRGHAWALARLLTATGVRVTPRASDARESNYPCAWSAWPERLTGRVVVDWRCVGVCRGRTGGVAEAIASAKHKASTTVRISSGRPDC